MRFVCDSCRAQYMISDDKVGVKGVKVRCKKCGYVILVRRAAANGPAEAAPPADEEAGPASSSSSMPFDPEDPSGSGAGGDSSPGDSGDSGGTQAPAPANGTAEAALSGIQDDEIGAVFDQVLKSGPHKIEEKPSINSLAAPPEDENLDLGMDDDLSTTRAVSTDALKKLVAEAEAQATRTAIPNDWFVAIDDAQQGPLTLEQVRDRWDRGEIGPDSLAWRAGMADWVPLSEITLLASELAPKPSKPVVAAPATSQVGTVLSVPVESTINVGGVSRTIRSESVMSAAPSEPAGDTGGWKPSAASALAALVSEEMSALSSKPKPRSLLESGPSERPNLSDLPRSPPPPAAPGMFDIPSAPQDISSLPNGKFHPPESPTGTALTQPPQQPYAGPSVYGGASYPSYAAPQPTGMSTGVKAGIGIAAALVLLLGGAVVFLLGRSPDAPVTPPAVVEAPRPTAPVDPEAPTPASGSAAVPMPPPPAGMVAKTPEPTAPDSPVASGKPEPVAAAAPEARKPEPTAARSEPSPRPAPTRRTTSASGRDDGEEEGAIVARAARSPAPPPSSGGEDDFDKLFASDKAEKPAADTGTRPRRQPGYIPPPVASDTQESLSESDIMAVVVANKSDIVRCVNEMKQKEPGISGRLVMRWTIRTTGSTSGISAQTAEFKNSHMARCIGGLVKGWKFPRHRNQGPPINFPFVF